MPSPHPTPRRKIIAVDMDEVIADALGEHILRYNRDFCAHLTVADLRGRWLWDLVPAAHHSAIEQYMLSADFFSSLAVMPHAQRVLARLQSHYDIFIASAAMEVPSSFTAKFEWLAEHFPFIPTSHIVFCGDKSILRADFLIDDNPRQLRRFEGGEAGESRNGRRAATPAKPPEAAPAKPLEAAPAKTPEAAPAKEPDPAMAGDREFRREGILFTSPANAFVTDFRRVDSWLDVEQFFLF